MSRMIYIETSIKGINLIGNIRLKILCNSRERYIYQFPSLFYIMIIRFFIIRPLFTFAVVEPTEKAADQVKCNYAGEENHDK